MSAQRIAELHLELARIHRELAAEMVAAPKADVPAEPARPAREVTELDRQRARRALRRAGVKV